MHADLGVRMGAGKVTAQLVDHTPRGALARMGSDHRSNGCESLASGRAPQGVLGSGNSVKVAEGPGISSTYPPFRKKPQESYVEWKGSVEFWIGGGGGQLPVELIGPRMMVQLKDRAAPAREAEASARPWWIASRWTSTRWMSTGGACCPLFFSIKTKAGYERPH